MSPLRLMSFGVALVVATVSLSLHAIAQTEDPTPEALSVLGYEPLGADAQTPTRPNGLDALGGQQAAPGVVTAPRNTVPWLDGEAAAPATPTLQAPAQIDAGGVLSTNPTPPGGASQGGASQGAFGSPTGSPAATPSGAAGLNGIAPASPTLGVGAASVATPNAQTAPSTTAASPRSTVRPFDAQSLQTQPAGSERGSAPAGGVVGAPTAAGGGTALSPSASAQPAFGTTPASPNRQATPPVQSLGGGAVVGTASSIDAAIEVTTLSSVRAASAGVAPAGAMGLPATAWRGVTEAEAIALLDRLKPTALHAANRLAVQLLSISLEPPAGGPDAGRFGASDGAASGAGSTLSVDEQGVDDLFTARLRALTRFGALDVAAQLGEIGAAPLHPNAVDAALLSARDIALCDALLSRPPASLDAEALSGNARSDPLSLTRIYCLTLVDDAGGAGTGAIAAIDAARSLGENDEITLSLLAAAADPDYAEFVDAPTDIDDLTPLRLSAVRRAGKELPSDFARSAPLELLSPRLEDLAPRAQLEALERLERAGAIPTEALASAFAQLESAESGGVWGRVEAYRGARGARLPDTIRSFRLAISRATEAEREAMMSRLLAADLTARASAGAPMQDALLRRAMRLGGEGDAASALMSEEDRRAAGPEERALDRIAAPHWGGTWNIADLNPLLARAARGDRRAGRLMASLNAFGVDTPDPALYATATDVAFARAEGRFAALAFGALAKLSAGSDIAPDDLYEALRMLIASDFGEAARQIAVEAILLGD